MYKKNVIALTEKEKNFLELLTSNQGLLVTFDEIIEVVWKDSSTRKNAVRNLVYRLRKKFKKNMIKGIPCSGYSI